MKTGFIFKQLAEAEGVAGTLRATSSLSQAVPGFRGIIRHQDGVTVPMRLREMGFVPGTNVEVLRQGPLGDPVEIELRGYRICLRRSDLAHLQVESLAPERR